VKEDAMGEVTPMMAPEKWAALERLLEVARTDTHQARYAANFLTLREDLVALFGFIARSKIYPSSYSFRSEFEDLVRRWRPEIVTEQR